MASPKAPSAKLLARRGASIQMNKAGVDALYAGMADGLIELGDKIIGDAVSTMRPGHLDAPPYGEGLIKSGFVTVWGQGKLVHGSAQVAASKNKPRGLKVPKDQVVMIAAFASPLAHLHELGTVKMPARPFLTPALMANIGNAGPYVSGAMSRRAASAPKRAAVSAAIKARIGGAG